MHGFEERDGALPTPPVQVADATRDRLVKVVASMISGATPEEIAGYLEQGFPASVDEMLARPHERDELSDHVNLLLATLQTPTLTAA